MATATSVKKLFHLGTSTWYDNISRDLLESGELKRMISEWGVRGLTSNPTIFENAVRSSSIYDSEIQSASKERRSTAEIFEDIAVQDIKNAADLLFPVFEESQGGDGFVSIEVSPLLARDTAGTIEEGRRLFKRIGRPNVMIKVPGTDEGIPAVRALLEEGINVNITLLFSVENYEAVARTYIAALRARKEQGKSVDSIQSVASFFVSRVDSAIDARLDALAGVQPDKAELANSLRGTAGICNSRLAYESFERIFRGQEFADLAHAGANVQRPLWASTGTKDPRYSDVLYVEQLVGPETVNTVPHATLEAFVDHGKVERATLFDAPDKTSCFIAELKSCGIEFEEELDKLQKDGVKKFSDSFASLIQAIEQKSFTKAA